MELTMMTELDAVNLMLEALGEAPVDVVAGNDLTEVVMASSILKQISRQVQSRGFACNTDYSYSITPDVNNEINLPTDALRADPSDPTKRYVLRGRKLYDPYENTYEFNEAVELDLVTFLDYESLTPALRNYIALKAARVFHQRLQGGDTEFKINKSDEDEAWREVVNEETEQEDCNVFDGYDVYKVIARNHNPY